MQIHLPSLNALLWAIILMNTTGLVNGLSITLPPSSGGEGTIIFNREIIPPRPCPPDLPPDDTCESLDDL
ncbi:hypothetical protein BDN72DRAFT_839471 [Pluteus cervinus]|uniref:Uncharacterized protein n=1 Tax=Pluteus cervinus TaxID=181527 RepID=A0ACD3AW90_9AGAR|nr:hypothetical protein BDN72DRAFT_839471 [Pluteus cervinus]